MICVRYFVLTIGGVYELQRKVYVDSDWFSKTIDNLVNTKIRDKAKNFHINPFFKLFKITFEN